MTVFFKNFFVIIGAIIAFSLQFFRQRCKELEKENDSLTAFANNSKKNARINKKVNDASFGELSDKLLAKQKNRRRK